MYCEKCKKPLYQNKNSKIKFRTNILVFEKSNVDSLEYDIAIIKCPNCKTDNKVPIKLDFSKEEILHFIIEK